MKRRNPTHSIKSNISIPINGMPFDYTVKTTIFGEVLRVQNLFLKLPKAAREMLLTGDKKTILQKVKAYEKLIPYIVPFVLFEHIQVVGYEELVAAFQERRATLEAKGVNVEANLEGEDWIAEFHQARKKENENFKDHFNRLGAVLAHIHLDGIQQKTINRRPSMQTGFSIIKPMLALFIPMFDDENRRFVTYRLFEYFPSSENRIFLLKQLRKEKNHFNRNNIIEALKPYDSDEISEALLRYTRKKRLSKIYELNTILDVLKPYKHPEVKDLAWRTLRSMPMDLTPKVIKMLCEHGISEQDIVAFLMTILENKRQMKKWTVALKAMNAIKQTHLLPTQEKLLQIAVAAKPERIVSSDFNQYLGWLLSKCHDEQLLEKLYQIRKRKNPNLPSLILTIFNTLYQGFQADEHAIPYQSHNGLKKQFLDWFNKGAESLSSHAMLNLALLYSLESDNSIISLLLEKVAIVESDASISAYRKARRQLTIMNSINIVMKNTSYHAAVDPLYKMTLKHQEAELRAKAIEGFLYEPNFVSKSLVLQTEHDKKSYVVSALKKYHKALNQH